MTRSTDVQDDRPTVMMIVPYYLPGFRAGGPIQTVSAIVERLGDVFRFRVVTSDRDKGDEHSYSDVLVGRWMEAGPTKIRYLSPEEQTFAGLRQVVLTAEPDVLYVHGFFHPVFTFRVLLLRRLGLVPKSPVLLAPRGHLSRGARSVKSWRKRAYIALVKLLGLLDDVTLHASDEMERQEILGVFPEANVRIAPNVAPPVSTEAAGPTEAETLPGAAGQEPVPVEKTSGRVQAVFLSRVVPQKNLKLLLKAVRTVSGSVELSVVGPVGDERYWLKCKDVIEQLPAGVQVEYKGPVPHWKVPAVLSRHHVLVLPTRSENFGHVIREALQVGRPVLISDRTPWDGVEDSGAGWVCALKNIACFTHRLEEVVALDQKQFDARCEAARDYARQVAEHRDAEARTRSLLFEVLENRRSVRPA